MYLHRSSHKISSPRDPVPSLPLKHPQGERPSSGIIVFVRLHFHILHLEVHGPPWITDSATDIAQRVCRFKGEYT